MYKNLVIIALVLFAAACSNTSKDKNAQLADLKKQQVSIEKQIADLEKELGVTEVKTENAVNVAVTTLSPESFRHFIEVQGKVESDKNVNVTPMVPGALVIDVPVKRGDRVSKGQVLARLDGGVMAQTLQEIKGQLTLARTVFEKQKNLWEQKIGSEIQFLQAKNNYESLENRLRTLNEQYAMYTLKAPFAGTVDEVNIKVGEIPTPGMSYIRVVNPDDVKVTAEVSEAYISKVKVGDKVIVHLPDVGQELKSKVRTVSTVINANSRSFTIEVDPDSRKDMRPNMIAIVKINDYSSDKSLVLPVNVVQRDETSIFVYVAQKEGDKLVAKKKVVTTGQIYGGRIEILSGIDSTDQVITTGYQSVVDGQAIAI